MLIYNDGTQANSTIDGAGSVQMNPFYWQRRALIEARKEMYFTPLADVTAMPKHYGKEIRVYHYIPLLDDRNVNDQGIDAAGVTRGPGSFTVTYPSLVVSVANAGKAAAVTAIQDDADGAITAVAGADDSAGAGFATITLSTTKAVYANATKKDAVVGLNVGASVIENVGNLYGSSKDVGTITSKMPTLTENGGRVNRVGFTRIMRTGQLYKVGFFHEWTQESMDFDSDADLYQHLSRELVTGAVQMSEAVLQQDLLAGAGVVIYAGAATQDSEVTGVAGTPSVVDYDDLMRLNRVLNDNRTPKQTKIIKGSKMIDTATIGAGRVIYVGSELQSILKGMTDLFGNAAFIPVHKYAAGGMILNGEIGTIDHFRIVEVPEMLHWAGAGAAEGVNPGYEATNGRYDVFPMLCVGDGSFTTIGFQTGGKSMKFKIITKKPGKETADRNDPYGETGFSSIKWYYGTMILRPERLAVIKTVAKV